MRDVGTGVARVSPWERGRRAAAVRAAVAEAFGGFITGWAQAKASDLRGNADADFFEDARELVDRLAEEDKHSCLSPESSDDDVDAAVVSVYAEAVRTSHGSLYLAYQRSAGERLRHVVAPALRMMKLRLRGSRLDDDVLQPMADYVLGAVASLLSDPNVLIARGEGRARLASRPFGWTPGVDAVGGSLSMLVLRQGRRIRWSRALAFSPLAVHLRSSGMIARMRCEGLSRLIASSDMEGTSSAPDDHWTERSPAGQCLRRERTERARRIALDRARTLWASVRGSKRAASKLSVLTALAGLDEAPTETTPRDEWLERIVARCMEERPALGALHAKASGVMRALKAPGRLTSGNLRVILSRFRATIRG